MDEGKIKETNVHYRDQSERNMILEEIFQVQNKFSVMDGNSYLSLEKTKANKPRNELTMGANIGHLPL